MSEFSSIEWTDATWNPVTGCTKVSQGCKHCYAETFAERWRGVPGHPYEQGFDLKLWPDRLRLPLEWRESRRIFVNSMSDLYHPGVPDGFIRNVFATMVRAKWHTFQVLTKRAERLESLSRSLPWRANIWQGVSVEDVRVVDRIEHLRRVPAVVRFLSLEPLIGPLDDLNLRGIHWVIVGGESGRGARLMNPEWVRSIRRQCREQDVPFFFKQFGTLRSNPNPRDPTAKENGGPSKGGRTLSGRVWGQFPSPRFARAPTTSALA